MCPTFDQEPRPAVNREARPNGPVVGGGRANGSAPAKDRPVRLALPVPAGRGLLISRGGWLASTTGVEIDAKWGGMKNLFGGEGGFIVRASGEGDVVLACFGALDVWDLAPGERFVLDSNHMVAYDETVTYILRRAVEGKTIQSMTSGEGLVFEFTGPGKVYGQTRSPQSLISWLSNTLSLSSSSSTGSGLGNLLGFTQD
mgnify:CR=1 FL=1